MDGDSVSVNEIRVGLPPENSATPEEIDATPEEFTDATPSEFALIVNMRLYDVLMGIYTHLNPNGAANLAEIHDAGKLLGAPPGFDGEFVSETLKARVADTP